MSLSSSSFKPGDELVIDKQSYTVQPSSDPLMKNKPYIEWGGSGQVLQLLKRNNQELYALKFFHKTNPRMLEYTDILRKNTVASLPGLAVANRYIIEATKDSALTKQYPNLEYAVLMPWIKGNPWYEILVDNKNEKNIPGFTQGLSLILARELARVLMALENRNLAHCDICSNNIILNLQDPSVNLIDIEDMYIPGSVQSRDFLGGQPGYAHPNRNGHQWVPESDRFGGGLLISEILSWYNSRITSISGPESFFNQQELLTDVYKYKELREVLGEQGDNRLISLFDKLWHSSSIQDCPKLDEWYISINALVEKKGIVSQATGIHGDFGQDGRIRPRRKKVEFSTDNVQPTTGTGRKKVDIGTSRPSHHTVSTNKTVPAFQKGTDWGQVFLVIFIIMVVLGLCLGLAISISGSQAQPTPTQYIAITQIATTIPKIVVPTATKYIAPTATKYIAPTNTRSPTKTVKPTLGSTNSLQPISPNYKCPDKDRVELQVGASGKVRKYDVNLRKEPVVPEQWDANVIRVLQDGEKIKVVGGPRCSHDGTWWEVRSESGSTGWVREIQPSLGRLIIRIEP